MSRRARSHLLLDELILELDEELEEDEALTTNEVPRLQNRCECAGEGVETSLARASVVRT